MELVLFILKNCPYCKKAMQTVRSQRLRHREIIVPNTEEAKGKVKRQNRMMTFPQIFLQVSADRRLKIGGSDDLEALLMAAKGGKETVGISPTLLSQFRKLL